MAIARQNIPAGRALAPRLAPWRRILLASAFVAVVDGVFAFVVYVSVTHAFTFTTLQQFIASGLLGPSAFASGPTGAATVALGIAIHVAIAVVVTLVYALTLAPLVRTPGRAVITGLAYGAGFWIIMNLVVLPLGRSGHEPFMSPNYVAFLIEHAVLVGLPIAVIMLGAYAPRVRGRAVPTPTS